MNMRQKLLKHITLIAATAALLAASSCKKPAAKALSQEDALVPVVLAPVSLRGVQRGVDVVGTLFGQEDTTVSAKVPGRVIWLAADIGDRVAMDQPLARIDPVDYQLAVEQKELALKQQMAKLGLEAMPRLGMDLTQVPTVRKAQLQADNAQQRYQRGKQLHQQKPPLLSDQDFADLQTTWQVAASGYDVELLAAQAQLSAVFASQADLDAARQKLQDATVKAPQLLADAPTASQPATSQPAPAMQYAVAARLVSVGEYVKEATPLYRLVADEMLKLQAAVPERFISQVKVGQKVVFHVEAYQQAFDGTVARLNPQVDPASRTFQVQIQVPNPQRLLKAGAFARAQILTRHDRDVLFAPQEAIVSFAGVNKVYVVENGRAAERRITTGVRDGDFVEIVSGLTPTDRVAVSGTSKLAPGVAVSIRQALPPSTAATPTGQDEAD